MPLRGRYRFEGVEGVRVGRLNLGLMSTFVLYRLGGTLIDSGPPNQWAAVKAFVDEKPPVELLLTHHHEDHSGNAARIAARCGITPYAPPASRGTLAAGFDVPLMQRMIWGSPVPVQTQPLPALLTSAAGPAVQAIPTPGHAPDHHCLYIPERGWLFTADLFIARRLKYLRADERLDQLLFSLQRVLALDFDVIFCAHRGIVREGKQPLQDKLDNLLAFCQEAQDLARQGLDRDEITRRLLGREGWMGITTGYNFSKRNLVEQALQIDPP